MAHFRWRDLYAKTPTISPSLLAFATLGGTTEIEMILIAKVRKAKSHYEIAGVFAYKFCPCKLAIIVCFSEVLSKLSRNLVLARLSATTLNGSV
jgi:hypothetical protein